MDKRLPIICLMGTTATGKTDLAAHLFSHLAAEGLPVELISVDAAQVYRGMTIGTAKPDNDFLARFPHHLIDIRDPDHPYSAADFCQDADDLITQTHGRGRIPLLVGGTMFYYAALRKGLSPLPSADPKLRAMIDAQIAENGLPAAYRELQKIDVNFAQRLESNDRQRIQRGLEIYRLTGETPSKFMADNPPIAPLYRAINLGLFLADRKWLHQRIAQRFLAMIEQGLIDEVQAILSQYPNSAVLTAMRIVGYRQVAEHLAGDSDRAAMIDRATAATRQLAKRQLTWMRQQSGLIWLEAGRSGIDQSLAEPVKVLLMQMLHAYRR